MAALCQISEEKLEFTFEDNCNEIATETDSDDEEDYYLFAGPRKNKDDQLEDVKRIDRVLEKYPNMKFITPAEFLQKMFPHKSKNRIF